MMECRENHFRSVIAGTVNGLEKDKDVVKVLVAPCGGGGGLKGASLRLISSEEN